MEDKWTSKEPIVMRLYDGATKVLMEYSDPYDTTNFVRYGS
jgi:hypothetical protein